MDVEDREPIDQMAEGGPEDLISPGHFYKERYPEEHDFAFEEITEDSAPAGDLSPEHEIDESPEPAPPPTQPHSTPSTTTPSGMKTTPFTPTPPPISSPLLPGHPFLQLSLPPVPSSLQRTLTGIPSLTPPTVSVVSCRGVLQYGLKTHLASIAARISGMFV
jgi:hypothetical protein